MAHVTLKLRGHTRRSVRPRELDLAVTCDMWVQALAALPRAPATWDDGVDGALLCHCSSRCTMTRRKGRRCCASVAAPCTGSTAPRLTTVTSSTCRGLRDVAINV